AFRYPLLVVVLVALAVVGSVFANLIFVALGWTSSAMIWRNLGQGLKIAIAITLAIGIVAIIYETLTHRLQEATLELRTRQLEEERARKLATEARLSS